MGFRHGTSRSEPDRRFKTSDQLRRALGLDWRSDISASSTTIGSFGFVGINTALLCHRKVEDKLLALHIKHLNDHLAKVFTPQTTTVCLGHHPIAWMAEWNEQQAASALQRNVRGAHIYLHGHLHDPGGGSMAKPTGGALCTFAAGASYQGATDPHSFWLIELHPDSNRVEPSLYRYSVDNGTFDIDPSMSRSVPMILRAATNTTLDTNPRAASTPASLASLPSEPPPLPLNSTRDLLIALDKTVGLIWEPSPTKTPTDIFWPVRLREPTLIHAGQAFIAAALQRTGCTVHLCLDDFGRAECTQATFEERISAHFRRAEADYNKVRVTTTKQWIDPSTFQETWEHFSQWMSKANNLQEILEVCKLLASDSRDLATLVGKKPRKLMTPAVVWTAFALCKRIPTDSNHWVTLGGFDEQGLWKVWRSIFSPPPTDHLFLSVLSPLGQRGGPGNLTMAAEPLRWGSRADIETSLALDDQPPSVPTNLLGWLIRYCLLLPARLNASRLTLGGHEVARAADLFALDSVPRPALLNEVADSAWEVLLT